MSNDVADRVIGRLKFNEAGLIPAVAQQHDTGEMLMLAWMNADAIRETLATGQACYFSRSRGKLWRKGESSGMTQKVEQMLTDCDQDAIVLKVTVGAGKGGAVGSCHVGYANCFYRAIEVGKPVCEAGLEAVQEKVYDPAAVYGDKK